MIATCKSKELYSVSEAKITLTIEGKRNEGVNGSLFLYIPLQQHSRYELGVDYNISIDVVEEITEISPEGTITRTRYFEGG